ncbi:hypothetical protein [Streptomyces lancefieldiae]|uniref:Uncharacterized protein n=1 Tax=Streptomyces lancefieldiae TaxID=3075520 RepID=A0ABU3AT87_9ACTN|nr:hypothetical protein [Streptomyces sp. DSM 40712]MDT0613389.1 hypothetical protein [Streptomyces sp. DSM 40712]
MIATRAYARRAPASAEFLAWFSPAGLAAFKGNAQLLAGHHPQARAALVEALGEQQGTAR